MLVAEAVILVVENGVPPDAVTVLEVPAPVNVTVTEAPSCGSTEYMPREIVVTLPLLTLLM